MEITKEHIAKVVRSKHWIIRADNDGVSPSGDAHGFKWAPLGEWTEEADWDESPNCGHGLHGQDYLHGGNVMGERLVFCETQGKHIAIGDNKVKVRKARILLINSLPDGLTVGGWLDLSGTGITTLPDGLTVGGSLDLSGTGITTLPDGLTVGGKIYRSEK